jgi:N-acetylneuraminic acid mutarotase
MKLLYLFLALAAGAACGEDLQKKSDPMPANDAASAALPDLPLAITSFGADRIGDSIFVYGGHHGAAHQYSSAGQSGDLLRLKLDEPTKWEAIAQGPKSQGLALVAHGGALYRIGGFTARNAEGEEQDLWSSADFARFDPTTEKWEELPAMPSPRSSFDAVVLGDVLYVVGGWAMQGEKETEWQATALSIDLSAAPLGWRTLSPPPFKRRAMTLGAHDGRVYVIGGMQPDGKVTGKTAIYNPADNTWSEGPALPGDDPMEGFGADAAVLDGRLYVSTATGKLLRLSDDEKKWESAGQLAKGRFFHRMVPREKGRFMILGGAHMEQGRFVEVDEVGVGK